MILAAFLHAAMLWGAALLAVPLIIHLINRRRVRVVTWAAMDFLLQAFKKRSRRMRLENLLLLLLRCAIPVIAALALARPYFGSQHVMSFLADAKREVVVVLDHSYSMDRATGASTLYQNSVSQVRRLMDTLDTDRGDTLTLLTMGRESRVQVLRSPSRRDWVAALDRLERPSYEPADLSRAVEALQSEVLPEIPAAAEVFLFTDLQRATFEPPLTSDEALEEDGYVTLKDRLRQIVRDGALLTIINVADGRPEPENLTVEDLRVGDPIAITRSSVRLTASVVNQGRLLPATVTGRFRLGEQERQVTLSFDKDGRASAEIYHSFQTPGDHGVEFELDEDDLADDNARSLRVNVHDSVPVLVVDGDPGGDEMGGEVGNLLLVLDPLYNRSGSDGLQRFFEPRWVSHHEFNRGELRLGDYQAVLLANVREIDERMAVELENYARRGGGVWFFLGDRVMPESYNQRLYRPDGSGLLPMPLASEPVGDLTTVTGDPTATRFYRMQVMDELHPMVRTFVDDRRRRYLASPVTRYLPFQKVDPLPASVRVPVRYDRNDEPALVDQAVGAGHVVWLNTSIDSKDNWSLFVTNTNALFPLVWDVTNYLVQRDPGTHLLAIGGAIQKSVPVAPSPYTVTRPDGEVRQITDLPTEPVLGHFALPPFTDTEMPGLYALDLPIGNGPPITELFAVNVDPAEGRLDSLDRDQFSQLLDPELFRYDTEIVQSDVQEAAQKQGEIWKTLVAVLLALLVIETLLAWRFGAYS